MLRAQNSGKFELTLGFSSRLPSSFMVLEDGLIILAMGDVFMVKIFDSDFVEIVYSDFKETDAMIYREKRQTFCFLAR